MGDEFPSETVRSSGGNETPVLGSHLPATSLISQCNPRHYPPPELPPAFLAITICYRDDIPLHRGFGAFGFRYDEASKQYVTDDVAADPKLSSIASALRGDCADMLRN
ncbi:MAG TPA: hypothetical protein VGX96_04970 [Candidatus Elarobacter sp.]|jgi:hypothetical protein|nr:hypothetical protein [Candidatus Elarobacter sp.]